MDELSVRCSRALANAVPFLIYFILSLFFFGRGLLGHITTYHFGIGEDPPLMTWFLAWWPHAIANGLNPFLTIAIWEPNGFNLAWQTSIPLISLLAAPLTETLGPLATLNILCLLAPALAGWAAYLVCREITQSNWSVAGGYIFGFSPYILGQLTAGHLHTLWIFPIPLALYLCQRFVNGNTSTRKFVVQLTPLLVAQFLISIEIFATMAIFGGLLLLLALGTTSGKSRRRIWDMLAPLACSWAIALLLVSPYIYYFFAYGFHREAIWLGTKLSADALNFLIPGPTNQLGIFPYFYKLSARFNGGFVAENMAFLAWPLFFPVAVLARKHWREPMVRLTVESFFILAICALGPILVIGGKTQRIALPWMLLQVPVLNNAATGRFSMYIFLDLAIMVTLWLSTSTLGTSLKLSFAVLTITISLPNLSAKFWVSPADSPAFFSTAIYKQYLSADQNVLILPYGARGESMYWQAEAQMFFRMAQGAGLPPGDAKLWPVLDGFAAQTFTPNAPRQFQGYLSAHGITAVIATDRVYPLWHSLLSALKAEPVSVGGVKLFRIPCASDNAYLEIMRQLRTDFDTTRFEDLVVNTDNYLRNGGRLKILNARDAPRLGVIPVTDLIGPPEAFSFIRDPQHNWFKSTNYQYGVALFTTSDDQVAIGEFAWYPVAKQLIAKYSPIANRVETDSPPSNSADTGFDSDRLIRFVMTFDRERMHRAAALAANDFKQRTGEPPLKPEVARVGK